MPISYTNRKGQTYILYRGKTKTGKPRYYFGRAGQSQGEPVTELPAGFAISESINGVVSLVKDRPSLIQPEEMAAVEQAVRGHPQARRYRVVTKHDSIEIYEQSGPDLDMLSQEFQIAQGWNARLDSALLSSEMERFTQYVPVLRFTLLDPTRRWFGAKRMCYLSSFDGWLDLSQTGTGPVAEMARELIPTLGTDQFFELW